MVAVEGIYPGADYGLDPNYGLGEMDSYGNFTGYRVNPAQIGFPSDPRTANQIDAVSKKISTGAKTIEVSAVNIMGGGGPMKLIDSIPRQQFKEIERLKKLTGIDLTFHGPLVEPTGISRQGWHDVDRQQAEKEIVSAIDRGHKLNPKGNTPIVFHSSAIGLDPETRVINEKTGKEIVTQISVIDERTGQIQQGVGPPTKDYLSKDPEVEIKKELKKQNEDAWFRALQSTNFNANQGYEKAHRDLSRDAGVTEKGKDAFLNFYKDYVKSPEKAEEVLKKMNPEEASELKNKMMDLTNADIYMRDAYQGFKTLFNQAYHNAEEKGNQKDLNLLDKYRKKLLPRINELEDDPSKMLEFGKEINEGVNVLRQIAPPQNLRPMKEFMIDKASDTFANAAFKSYKKFKETSPVIAIENPPAGAPLSRADELRDLVKDARKKFAQRAQRELGMSESQAKKQAEKLIGATWDLGHINMIRKFGYEEKDVIKETKKIAPYVKHVHLSDNFGLEHTELPMGMGNVPTKKHLELIEKYNKQAKKIVETGDWFSTLRIPTTPVMQSFTAMGSPVYSMRMSPYWNQIAATSGAYQTGFGATNPDIHHSIYGAGYSNLPVELGGQMAGQSRVSGAPMQ